MSWNSSRILSCVWKVCMWLSYGLQFDILKDCEWAKTLGISLQCPRCYSCCRCNHTVWTIILILFCCSIMKGIGELGKLYCVVLLSIGLKVCTEHIIFICCKSIAHQRHASFYLIMTLLHSIHHAFLFYSLAFCCNIYLQMNRRLWDVFVVGPSERQLREIHN